MDNLDKNHLITKSGATKGAYYQVNPALLTNAKSNVVTTLRTIEPYVLKALIKEERAVKAAARKQAAVETCEKLKDNVLQAMKRKEKL